MTVCENPDEFKKELAELMEKHGVTEFSVEESYGNGTSMVFTAWDDVKCIFEFEGTSLFPEQLGN